MLTKNPPTAPPAMLLRVPELAALMAISPRGIWSMISAGKIPPEAIVRIGASVRFKRAVVESWIEAGCPAPVAKGTVRHAR